MTSRLITKPSVRVVARTVIDEKEIVAWADENGIRDDMGQIPEPVLQVLDGSYTGGIVEFAGRHCYRSWWKGRKTYDYIENIIESNHGSVLEHLNLSFVISGVSRTLSHEMVRHRVGVAISQESQRYVSAEDIRFVIPPLYLWLSGNDITSPMITKWASHCYDALAGYNDMLGGLQDATLTYEADRKGMMLDGKRRTEAARSLLPGCAETRMTWTANIRLLRHFLQMRGGTPADLEIRRMAIEMYCAIEKYNNDYIKLFFHDIDIAPGELGVSSLSCQS